MESHSKSRRSRRGAAGPNFVEFPIDFDPMDPATRFGCAKHFARLSRRWVLVFCQVSGLPLWREAGETYGLGHRRECIWVKPDSAPQFTGDRPGTGYECFEAMHAKGVSRWNGGGRRGVFVYNCNSGARRPDLKTT